MTKLGPAGWIVVVAGLILAGCEASGPSISSTGETDFHEPAAPVEMPVLADDTVEEANAEMVREKAQVGVGVRGSELGDGPVSTPIKAYFSAREQVAFNIQLPSTMQLFKAEHGRAPRSHEEFMEKIIKGGAIQLPELPAGHRYVYDPEKEELFVEHP